MTIEFWWRQIFEILMIHKPSLESLDVPQKIWGWSVQPFWRFLDTNKQTDKQTDKPNLFIDIDENTKFYSRKWWALGWKAINGENIWRWSLNDVTPSQDGKYIMYRYKSLGT